MSGLARRDSRCTVVTVHGVGLKRGNFAALTGEIDEEFQTSTPQTGAEVASGRPT
jgi:hypothetical protein